MNATATQFSVAAVTATSGFEVFDLFVPQEAVLIEGETVWAAHITFWPGSWMLNLSALCPKAAADVAERDVTSLWDESIDAP